MCKMLSPEFLYSTYDSDQAILFLSHGAAIVLLSIYAMFLFFRLYSHRYLWQDEESIDNPDDEEEETALPPFWIAHIFALILIIAFAILCAKYLVTSVPGLVASSQITATFTGLVLLPIITHLCKYIKTSVIAYQGHPEIAVAMTLGASVDIAFFTLPVLVLVGWVIGRPMTMEFELLETIITVLSILVMAGFVMDGKSNYLEGAMSLGL
jgi:Ca2+:H+ antiporter